MNENLTYIDIDKLHEHPDNPRKNVGDVTELAKSIKANGVLQNLTVVPRNVLLGEYTVIIGHRRLAAAKQAGLTELPCAIVEMSEYDQLSTMLTENMQRTDLTIYEQAKGFQMMLDMGDTVEDVAEKSGFSSSTIRRRVKLLELDEDKFKAADRRGATLAEYAELDSIKSTEEKNRLLQEIGTANFKNALKAAKDNEERQEYIAEVCSALDEFATKITSAYEVNGNSVPMEYVKYYSARYKESVAKPRDADKCRYFYTIVTRDVYLYKEQLEKEETDEEREKREAEEAEINEYKRRKALCEEMTKRHATLRREFVRELAPTVARKHLAEIVVKAWELINRKEVWGLFPPDFKIFQKLSGKSAATGHEEEWIQEEAAKAPEKVLLIAVCAYWEAQKMAWWRKLWKDGKSGIYHWNNINLNKLYALLCSLGYQMSDEEIQMQNGTHEVFTAAGGNSCDK